MHADACLAGADTDLDSLSDECELALATAFAPLLVVDTSDCRWQTGRQRIGGGYYHGVQPTGGGRIAIAYLPAYYIDCGLSGPKCRIPGLACRPHAGDSELIVVEAEPSEEAGRWSATSVFLSAHCFAGRATDCRWYSDEDLEAFAWRQAPLSAPVVWVAAGRHANYPSRTSCDRGHGFTDSCDDATVGYVFPVRAEGDIGSAAVPIGETGCVDGLHADPANGHAHPDRVECFWTERPFAGWQDAAAGVTPYLRYLTDVAGFTDAAASGTVTIERLRWLAGCWERRAADRVLEEQWMAPRAGTMLGMSRLVRGGQMVSHEAMRIQQRGDTLVYTAAPAGQAPAEFSSDGVTESVAVFQNPAHDFPQRIIYRHAAGDSLHARIEGLRDGHTRAVDFRMARVRCPG